MDILPPGRYVYSAIPASNQNINHNPPALHNVNDFYTVAGALNYDSFQHPLRSHFESFRDPGIHDLLMAMNFSESDSFNEGQIIIDGLEEEEEWQVWNFPDLGVPRTDFSSINRLSEDTVRKHLKTRSVVEDDREDKICVVCQDSLFQEKAEKIATLDCGHEYHAGCIKNWLVQKNRCPLCNAAGVSVNGRN